MLENKIFEDVLSNSKREFEKEPKYNHSFNKQKNITAYSIFRIGKKIKSMTEVKKFESHMERKANVLNADPGIKNKLLIGSENITDDVNEYISDVKLRMNSVIARDILLTASPIFFQMATENQKDKWVTTNVNWLKEKFRDNCTYATLHRDETTWHISALIVPKFYDEKRGAILANARYFDGPDKLRLWQDEYANKMSSEFVQLKRGIRFSKAKHIEIRQFYNMINKKIDMEDIQSLTANTTNSELLQKKIIDLNKTLNRYSNFNQNTLEENKQLHKTVNELKNDKLLYKDTIKTMSQLYGIPQNSVEKILSYVSDKSKDKANDLEINK